ncbi:HalOD1 output domain-containing protein [Natrialba taiwanensis]|uniref:Halobacterial output domain-containing protein n=1 Tax=Natrialba taiwanensis DSM 12281 TaxID=1230458 RepID=L9ZXF2_9EURY|nr:HalOD1 output domain-containing protein [Natrialba taiwanensis]ELY90756.1 hypothetical protein C484_11051 [Natrialba taiwanensis DSM 12281]
MGSGTQPSIEILQQIATAEGVEPTELEPPLYNVIDPDALDALVQSMADRTNTDFETQTKPARSKIEFTYCGYTVRVDETGRVDVRPTADRRPESRVNSTEDAQSD